MKLDILDSGIRTNNTELEKEASKLPLYREEFVDDPINTFPVHLFYLIIRLAEMYEIKFLENCITSINCCLAAVMNARNNCQTNAGTKLAATIHVRMPITLLSTGKTQGGATEILKWINSQPVGKTEKYFPKVGCDYIEVSQKIQFQILETVAPKPIPDPFAHKSLTDFKATWLPIVQMVHQKFEKTTLNEVNPILLAKAASVPKFLDGNLQIPSLLGHLGKSIPAEVLKGFVFVEPVPNHYERYFLWDCLYKHYRSMKNFERDFGTKITVVLGVHLNIDKWVNKIDASFVELYTRMTVRLVRREGIVTKQPSRLEEISTF